MYSFDANYDEEAAAQVMRTFFIRSLFELRRWVTFAPVIFFFLVAVIALTLGGPRWFVTLFGTLTLLSILEPLAMYFLRPALARKYAWKFPVAHFELTADALTQSVGGRSSAIPWRRFVRVWTTLEHDVLVVNPFYAVAIPQTSYPPGAREFVLEKVKSAAY